MDAISISNACYMDNVRPTWSQLRTTSGRRCKDREELDYLLGRPPIAAILYKHTNHGSLLRHSDLLAAPGLLHIALHALEQALSFRLKGLLLLLRPLATLLGIMNLAEETGQRHSGGLRSALGALVVVGNVCERSTQLPHGGFGRRLLQLSIDVGCLSCRVVACGGSSTVELSENIQVGLDNKSLRRFLHVVVGLFGICFIRWETGIGCHLVYACLTCFVLFVSMDGSDVKQTSCKANGLNIFKCRTLKCKLGRAFVATFQAGNDLHDVDNLPVRNRDA